MSRIREIADAVSSCLGGGWGDPSFLLRRDGHHCDRIEWRRGDWWVRLFVFGGVDPELRVSASAGGPVRRATAATATPINAAQAVSASVHKSEN